MLAAINAARPTMLNAQTLAVVMLESPQAIENADAIGTSGVKQAGSTGNPPIIRGTQK